MSKNESNLNESIILRVKIGWDSWVIYVVFLAFAVVGLIKIVDFFSNSYHGEDTIKEFIYGLLLFSPIFYFDKKALTQEFYISNLAIKIKKGISGELYSIDFKSIKLAALYKSKGSGLKIFCSNGDVIDTGVYTHSSITQAVQLIEQNDIKVFSNIEEAKEAANVIKNDNLVLACDSEHINTHYVIAFLPLLLSLLLYLGVVVNTHCGHQQTITIYATMINKEISLNKYDNFTSGRILVKTNEEEVAWFPVNKERIFELYSGERLRIDYKRGSLGLGYNIQIWGK